MSAASDIAEARAGRSDVRAAIARLSVYIRGSSRYYGIWAVITLAYVACFVAIPIMVGRGVDAIGEQSGPELARQALWIGIVALLSGALRYFSRELVFSAGREVEYEIRNDLFAHLQRLPQSFYFGWRTGDIMSRCVNDLNSVRLMLGPGLLSVVQTPVMLVGVLIAMAFFDPLLTLLVVAPYFLFVFIARAFGRLMFRANIAVQEGLADLSNHLQETISGIAVVKTYAMERVTAKRFAREIAQGTLTRGEFMLFAVYIWNLTFPTFIMGWVFSLVQRGAAAMQRIDEVLATEPSIADRGDLVDLDALRGEIEFRNLTFQYPGAKREPALRDVSFHVPAGSTLGVVGPVGSGKSTLASVIPRLYEVDDGSVFIDGVDLNRLPLATLRAGIAMVPQDSFLFSMSLADNVAFGLPEADPGRVALAVERAQLAKDLAELPHGLATVVGERGVMLSGGQRQRAALARALALEPGILILDDTLSSVDAATEEAIQHELAEVFAGRTVLVISHRISSVRDCDQIIVLGDGAISERGNHKELLLHGGFYARLARQQALEDALEEAVA
jgi:ATP-binding cassette subfamily B protein